MVPEGAAREVCRRALTFQSVLRFAVVSGSFSEEKVSWSGRFQSTLRFAVVPDSLLIIFIINCQVSIRFKVRGGFQTRALPRRNYGLASFQSALRFAVVPDLTPWHVALTSPVVAVLHTTPPHPLQQADRTCPQWGKTPSQVPYTPEAVFGRSPTPLSEGVSKMPGRRELGVFVGFYLGPGPVPRRGILPRARSGLLFGRR